MSGLFLSIDLVIDTPHAVMAIEIKVVPSSARYGQLAAQYRGLRRVTPSEKRVCSLLVFPGPTSREQEVRPYLVGRDRTGHITWGEVFGCVPSSPPVSADKLLAKLLEVARDTLPRLWVPGKTILTVERDVLHGTMREAVTRANELLANAATEFESCTWRQAFWRDPRLDQFYGGLRSPNGIRRRGQYLDISAAFVSATASLPRSTLRARRQAASPPQK